MIDPRPAVLRRRLAPVQRILAFASAKGGVGKSLCAALSALGLSAGGRRTGLLDLDFQGASAHLLLGAELAFPEEAGGIKPLRVRENLDFMSFAAFSRERTVPLRGAEAGEALLELLAITIWDPLELLLLDLPPGIGDTLLDLLRHIERTEFLVVATPSALVLSVVERLLVLLRELNLPLLGVVENMARPIEATKISAVAELAARYGAPLLGCIPYLPGIEDLLADGDLLNGPLGAPVRGLLDGLARRVDGTAAAEYS
jgi:ATP-binding protein involved in chromosome partitioning